MTPEQRDEFHYAQATVLKQIDTVGRMLPPLSQQKGYRFSRSAAIRIARDLILERNGERATRRLQSDLAGMLSFFALAQHLRAGFLNPGPYKPEEAVDQERPFGNLSDWLLTTVARVGQSWESDEDPVIPKEKQSRPPQWGG